MNDLIVRLLKVSSNLGEGETWSQLLNHVIMSHSFHGMDARADSFHGMDARADSFHGMDARADSFHGMDARAVSAAVATVAPRFLTVKSGI